MNSYHSPAPKIYIRNASPGTTSEVRVRGLGALLRRVPVVGRFADSEIVVRADSLSSAIVDYTTTAKKIIGEVEDALVHSDASSLKKYVTELDALRSGLAVLLKT